MWFQPLPLIGHMLGHAPSSRKRLKPRRWRHARSDYPDTLLAERRPNGGQGDDRGARWRAWPFVLRGALYPATFALLGLIAEDSFSFSAIWLRNPWLLRLALLIAASLALSSLAARPLRARTAAQPARAAGWALLWSMLPFMLAAGLYGAISGGPVLGDPHAAYGMLIGDLLMIGGALEALAILGAEARRARGAQPTLSRGAAPATRSRTPRPRARRDR